MSYFPEIIPEYRVNLDNELDVEVFVHKYGFYKIAESKIKPESSFIRNPDVSPIEYYVTSPNLRNIYEKYQELIYLICIDGKIVKIGGTYVGMKNRQASYNAGSQKARNKGTCSVTNYNVTQAQYAALSDGKTVEWYIYEVPEHPIIISDVFGDPEKAMPKTYHTYETKLHNIYKNITGHYPPLSKNCGLW